jgi:hypothetical protein
MIRYFSPWQRSSVVEQGTHKPLVSGPNPLAATFLLAVVKIETEEKTK